MKKVLFNLNSVAEELVKYAKKSGADDVQININDGKNFTVEVRNGNIERLTEAGSRGLSLKVIVDQKVANASSSDMNIDTLKKLVDSAIQRARLTSPDPFATIPETVESKVDIEKLNLFDIKILKMLPEQKIEFAKKMEEIALKDKRINISLGSYYATGSGETIIANSKGFIGSYKSTSCSAGVELQAGTNDNLFEDSWSESSLKLAKFSTPESIAQKAVERTVRMIGGKKIDTQKVPVVFDQQMSARLLGFLSQAVSGGSIYMNQSFLVNKLGTQIANKNINIIDDPLLPGRTGSRPFDSEGVAGKKLNIIENGVLKNYLLDTYSANKLKMKTTGHASGTSNYYLTAGKHKPEDIIRSVKKGMLLVKTIGFGFNQTTGDLSTGAYGIWIENGELTYPVSEITISGNLGKMLMDIEMIGNDLDRTRATAGPTIKIAEMTIAGK